MKKARFALDSPSVVYSYLGKHVVPPVDMKHSRILIKQLDAKEMTESGLLHLPGNIKKPNEGIVLAVGPGAVLGIEKDGLAYEYVQRDPICVKPGDHVMYGEYTGLDYTFDGEKYRVILNDDIFLVVRHD